MVNLPGIYVFSLPDFLKIFLADCRSKRLSAREHFIKHDAHGINIGPVVNRTGIHNLLRTHVGRGSQSDSSLGDILRDLGDNPL